MTEFQRVFCKRTWLLLAILGMMNLALFLLCLDPEKQITATGEELQWYLQQYPEFLKTTEKNSSVMSALSMYKSGYAAQSLKKTGERYRLLQGTEVTCGDNRGIMLLIQYRLSDLFLLLFLFLIVMEFQKERKKGLSAMVRTTLKGRGVLYLQRMGILVSASVLGAVVFYGGDFAGVHFSMGLDQLGRSLQSLPEFMKCPFSITIGQYLIISLLLKAFGGFTAAVLFYFLVGCLQPGIACLISGAFLGFEYLTELLIKPVSEWNGLHYINLITLIRSMDFFADCVYLNILGRAVLGIAFLTAVAGGISVMVTVLGFWMYGRRYAVQSRSGERVLDWIAWLKERLAVQHTLFGWELYKVLFRQWGFVILMAVLFTHISLSAQYKHIFLVDAHEQLYYIQFGGELTRETADAANQTWDNLKLAERHLEETLEEIQEKVPFNQDRYQKTSMALAQNRLQQSMLQVVMDDIRSGMEYTERTGNTIHIMDPYTYHMLLNLDQKTRTRASFLILVAVTGTMGGLFAFDTQNHMEQWIHTSFRGRWKNVLCKLGVLLLLCAGASVLINLVQFLQTGADMGTGYPHLNVPVQSLRFMREFPVYISIRGYLILYFGLRAGLACLTGLITAGISSRCQDTVTAVGIAAFAVLVPVALAALIPGCEWLNPIYLLNGEYFR